MAFYEEAHFIHQVDQAVHHVAQQRRPAVRGAVRTEEGVQGKTYPFQIQGSAELTQITVRDADTTYLNPPQSKRRAVLLDFGGAVLVDDFDKLKTLTNPQNEFVITLGYARARQEDRMVLSVPGLGAAGAAGTAIGGALGLATTVDEGAETTATSALPSTQQIVNGSTGGTIAKILDAKQKMDDADVDDEDRYFFYSPRFMRKLLTDVQATSSDYNTIRALDSGGFPMDQTWLGFKWRRTTRLPKSGNIRSCIALQKRGVGYAISLLGMTDVHKNPAKWNNVQAMVKMSAGAVRIEDVCVVQIDIDESV